MVVFVIGCRPSGGLRPESARTALSSLLADVPFLPGATIHDWAAPSRRFALAWSAHDPAEVGGVRYVHTEDRRVALFAGRPIRRLDGGGADGRGPLDPRHYLSPAQRWAPALDGRVAAARCDDDAGELELFSDALGAYPLFRCSDDGATWYSNSAEALRRLSGSLELDVGAVASVVGCGWPLEGHSIWRAVRRVPAGAIVRHGADGRERASELLPAESVAAMFGASPLDAPAAAETLVTVHTALADWPGRPTRVYLSGGRDSRVILAAALRSGLEVRAVTGGHPESADQSIARELCARAGVPHEELPADPHGNVFSDPATAARLVALTAAGTATAADGPGFPHGPDASPLRIALTGQGGEIARRYYGDTMTVDRLLTTVMTRRPWRPELLSADGVALVRDQIAAWAARQRDAGLAPHDLPDAFYLLRRMGTWAGPTHGAVEWVRDATSPMWSAALLPHLLGLSVAERRAEAFPHHVTAHLAPEIADVPFEDGVVWGAGGGRRTRALRSRMKDLAIRHGGLASRVARDVQRAHRLRRSAPGDPLDAVTRTLRDRFRERSDHPVLVPLDHARTLTLLDRPSATFDVIERSQALRLATVVAAWDAAQAAAGA